MPTPSLITDAELTDKIKASHLDAGQKTQLLGLITAMTQDERAELLSVIEASNAEVAKADADYNEKLGAPNKDHTHKMNDMVREESAYARKEFESFDEKQEAADMRALEGEIATSGIAPSSVVSSAREKPLSKKHTFRNFVLILFLLAALAAAALYALSTL
ncbi:hypothetical protein JXA05_03485 [Candidatus Peregrinibacteria bacterium]|nr:hypothetical protein [Candidatus Peregrinibacteria bacterium]